jgi:hypothetical protein
MLRFLAPKLPGWTPTHAHLLGPDELAIPAELSLAGDIIHAVKRIEGAAALAIQYPAPAPVGGTLTLRTALLPERREPYLLTLELARYQVMLMLTKLEEWALFETAPTDPVMAKIEEARERYTHALVVQGKRAPGAGAAITPQAQAAADEALAAALDAGEALALLSARVQHARRLSGELARLASRPPPDSAITDHEAKLARKHAAGSAGVILPDLPQVGLAVSPSVFAPALCDAIAQCADFLVVPMRWSQMEPTEGRYTFAPTDKWIEWAVTRARLPVVAGPVLDFESGCVPDFVYIWEHDYETLRDVVIEHVKAVVTRYRRTVDTWTICSGLHVGSNFAISYEQAVDLTRVCVTIVRKLHPGAKVQIEISQPWGEYTAEASARAARSIPPAVYCELLSQIGLDFDALALKVQMGYPLPGRSTRDLIAFSSLLDRFAQLDKPLALSMLGAPSSPVPPAPNMPLAGNWRAEWSPEQQALWLTRACAIAAGKPFVRSIAWQEVVDAPPPASPSGGLITGAGQPKPALAALRTLRAGLHAKAPALVGAH